MMEEKVIISFIRDLNQEYPIFIGTGLIEKVSKLFDINKYSQILVITDENIKPILLNKLLISLPRNSASFVLSFSEKEKNIENVQDIWKYLVNNQFDRKSLLINLGGGVVTDLGGFAASTYMRGVDFINIPTTLLSHVDASVGGKNGINFAGIKNLVGTFSQPKAVIIDVDTLSTLPKREFLSGFAEIIKHSLIKDKKYFEYVTSKNPLEFSKEELVKIILTSIKIKKDVIKDDETELEGRKILNFGHTIGHAVESISLESNKLLLHGEAISIGMIVEGKISKLLELLSDKEYKILEQSLINANLPTTLEISVDNVLEKIKSDKKNIKGETKFTLLEGIGKAVINKTVDESVIRKALRI